MTASAATTTRTRFALIVAATFVLLAVLVSARPARAGDGSSTVSLSVDGITTIGGAAVTIEFAGSLETAAAGRCTGGSFDEGTLVIGDGDEEHRGALTAGTVTVGCIPAFPNGLFAEARGYWQSVDLVGFTVKLMGTRSPNGSLKKVTGEILSGPARRRGSPDFFSFSGRFTGSGEAAGLAGAAAPDPGFAARLSAGLPPPPTGDIDAPAGDVPTGGRTFRLSADTDLSLGRGKVTVELVGRVVGGNQTCAFGTVRRGTVTVTDADTAFRGAIEGANVNDCGKPPEGQPGKKLLTIQVNGTMNDAFSTPFSLIGSGVLGKGGKANGVTLRLQMRGASPTGSPSDEVRKLRHNTPLYDGATVGRAAVTGLVPPKNPRPDQEQISRSFRLALAGHEGEHIALEATGNVYPGYEGQGTVLLNPQKATLNVGDTEYAVAFQYIVFRREPSGAGRLYLLGALTKAPTDEPPPPGKDEPEPSQGFIIAEIETAKPAFELFTKGGSLAIDGRIASLRAGSKTYRPEVTGTLTVKVDEG